MSDVCLNDLGIVCSLGADKISVLANLCDEGKGEYLTPENGLLVDGETFFVGRVHSELPSIENEKPHFVSRNNQLALAALNQIQTSIEELRVGIKTSRIGVIIGTSTSGILEGEKARKALLDTEKMPENFHYATQEMVAPAEFIAEKIGAKGPVYSISTACSSSAKALSSAKMLLEQNMADLVVCGGVDTLSQLPTNGFKSLESTSAKYCNPFGVERDGINIGEGAALFVMSKKAGEINLLSAGESSDAYHVSAPQPEGVGALESMTQAVNRANISASQLSYLNLHGTGTIKNDAMEAKAVSALCGSEVSVGSTKRFTGHTLGAAGAIEAGLCWLLLSELNHDKRLPVNKNNGENDATLNKIKLSKGGAVKDINMCLSNSFAFGGSNISLVIGKSIE